MRNVLKNLLHLLACIQLTPAALSAQAGVPLSAMANGYLALSALALATAKNAMQRFIKILTKSVLIMLLGFLFSSAAIAATKTFTGSGNFSNAKRWNGKSLPAAGDDLIINGDCVFDNAANNLAYGDLDVGKNPSVTLSWPVGGTNTLNVLALSSSKNASIDMTNGGTLQIRTSWDTSNQTFTPGAGTINWNVSGAASTLPADIAVYNNLTVDTGGQVANLGLTTNVNGTLTLTSGVVTTGANTLEVASSCATAIIRSAGYVFGNLKQHYPTNASGTTSCTFHIGDAATYTPVTVAMSNVTSTLANSILTARTDPGDHADTTAGTSGINAAKSVNRNWTLTAGGGLTFATYNAIFAFASADVDAGATTANFIVGRKSGSGWAFPAVSSANSNDTTAGGITQAAGFGAFAIGESKNVVAFAEWRMDESLWSGGANEVSDSAGSNSGRAASLAATKPSTANATPAIPGNPGTCRYGVFNRANKDYVALPAGFPNLGASTGTNTSFTITAWIRTTDNTQLGQRILIDDENNSQGYGFSVGDGGTGMLRFFSRGTPSALILDTGNVIANNTWYFVAAVADLPNKRKTVLVYNAAGTQLANVSATWTEASFGTGDAGIASIGGETNSSSGENTNAFGFAGNIDEVHVYQSALSSADVDLVRQLTHGCPVAGPDHYELSLPTSSVSCLPTTATVTACTDSSSPCTNAYTAASGTTATLSASGGTLGASVVAFNSTGVASTTLSYPAASNGAAVSVTLSGEQTAATNARKCCPDGTSCVAANSCSTTFSTTGFIFSNAANGGVTTIPTQVAGTSSGAYYLRAVKTSTITKACEAALVGKTAVNFAYECNNPTTCYASNLMSVNGGSSTIVQGNNNGSVSSYLPVNMTFDASGNAPFSFNYGDVGQVRFWASKTANSASLTGSSNTFVVKPGGFVLSGIQQTATPQLANPAAAGAAGAKFVKAGESFTATVTTVTSGGATTPNFGRENVAEGVKLTHMLVLPSGGAAGALSNATIGGSSFSSGAATVTNLAWDEVGIITLTPSVASANYLGTGDVTGTVSSNIGRFYPDHFALTPGSVTPACSGAFTYFGQDGFTTTFTLKAQGLAGATTANYTGSFAKLGLTTWSNFGFASASLTPAGSALLASATAPTGNWSNGAAAVTAKHQASRPPAPAVETAVIVTTTPVDADGVTMAPAQVVAAATPLRFGRLQLQNAYGSEVLNLPIPIVAQYWAGAYFARNALDSCTVLIPSNIALTNYQGGLTAANMGASHVAIGAISSGLGAINLAKPSPAASGSADLLVNLGSAGAPANCSGLSSAGSSSAVKSYLSGQWCGAAYDRDPVARATFGIRKTPLIYLRENF